MKRTRSRTAALPAVPLKLWLALSALALTLLAIPGLGHAQGVVRGARDGAYEGNRVAGPVGGAAGTVVGGVVGGVAGGVKGVLGIPQESGPRYAPRKRYYRARYDRRGNRRY